MSESRDALPDQDARPNLKVWADEARGILRTSGAFDGTSRIYALVNVLESNGRSYELERDEMRRANVTPEDRDRPLGQSVEYWQDRALDHATALDNLRVDHARLRAENEALREALRPFVQAYNDVNREFCPHFRGPMALRWFDDAAKVLDGARSSDETNAPKET